MTTKIGFYGVQTYDLGLYLSQILKHLHYKVLLLDSEKEGGIRSFVPLKENLPIISWNDVDYSADWKQVDETDYDFILHCDLNEKNMKVQNIVYYVTDLQLQNVEAIKRVREKQKEKSNFVQELIIRDYCNARKKKFIEQECKFQKSNYLLEGTADLLNMVSCQYYKLIRFKGISMDLKQMLLNMSLQVHGEKREVYRAYRKAERGKQYENCFLEQCSWAGFDHK